MEAINQSAILKKSIQRTPHLLFYLKKKKSKFFLIFSGGSSFSVKNTVKVFETFGQFQIQSRKSEISELTITNLGKYKVLLTPNS